MDVYTMYTDKVIIVITKQLSLTECDADRLMVN